MTRFQLPARVASAFLFLLTLTTAAIAQQPAALGRASVAGKVTDDSDQPIPGVTVTAARAGEAGSAVVAVTELDGTFRIDDLRPGEHVLDAMLDGFQPISRQVTLVTGQRLDVAFKLVPALSETIEVTAEAVRTGEVAILESRRQSAVVSDSISAEEIRKTPDSSAAGVVERLTGVTLMSNKYVYVRGLGERYGGTTVNGATLPTTETEKRVVPLDLFPARLLETVNVVKTYTPDKPGEFGSGVVEMTTTEFPSSAAVRVTLGSGFNTSTNDEFRRYAGGISRLGRGGQPLPPGFPSTQLRRRSVLDSTGYTPAELEQFGELLVGDWTGRGAGAPSPNTNYALTYGDTFGRVGVVFSAVSNHSFDTTGETQRFFGLDAGNVLVPRNDYDMTTDQEHATAGLVGNVSFRLSDTSHLSFNSVLTRDASSQDRYQEGLNTNTGGFIRDYRVRYQQEEVRSNRLRGDHHIGGPGIGSLIEWNVARSTATNDSNLRENLYRETDGGAFALQVGFAESGRMDFFGLEDNIDQGGLAYSLFYATASGKASGTIKAGADHQRRTRDFLARRFRFTTANQLQFDLTKTPDEIFTPANIGPNGFEIREVTGVNDAYDAEHTIDAAYLLADWTSGRWRLIAGARYEDSDQVVTTFNPFDLENDLNSINRSEDVLPSLNVVYQAGSRTNLRFAYGRSLNRPAFRELSPFTFVEVTGGRSVAGNPGLKQATLDAFDLRWETFPAGGEVIAASAFYKRIDSPIERIVQPTTELRTSFVNADEATLWGLELEFRRSLAGFAPSLRNFAVNFNYAYVHSDVTVGENDLSVITNSERPLEGQSDQVANAALQYLMPRWGTMFRILGSYSGERLTEVGGFGLPDIYEAAYASVDLVLSQRVLADALELKLTATNLLGAAREYRQGGELQRRDQPGRSVGISLSYSPF